MRDIEELKHDRKLLWATAQFPGIQYHGFITLHTGQKASFVMGTNEDGFEHVSIQLYSRRLPTWNEMNEVKETFWKDDEVVVQIHPNKAKYVNRSEALHLWRPKDGDWGRIGTMEEWN